MSKKLKEKYEFYNNLVDDTENAREVIAIAIKQLRDKAKDYFGYDFREEINELLKEMI